MFLVSSAMVMSDGTTIEAGMAGARAAAVSGCDLRLHANRESDVSQQSMNCNSAKSQYIA